MSNAFARAYRLLHRKRVSGCWYDMGGHKRAWNKTQLAQLNRLARLREALHGE